MRECTAPRGQGRTASNPPETRLSAPLEQVLATHLREGVRGKLLPRDAHPSAPVRNREVSSTMRPVRPGDRGPAVEDIQRRLLSLGYDLGRTGVDGVFLGATGEAVQSFQAKHRLAEDGFIGGETWSALVDEGFTLGDRMLYLRLPHFHGRDVGALQGALNALGFACGAADAIFGAYSERAVREFQRNAGLPADGIVGPETVRTLSNLRHVWEGKDSGAHTAAHIAPARAAEVLERIELSVRGDDEVGRRIAERIVNLAQATTPAARVTLGLPESDCSPSATVLRIRAGGTAHAVPGRPVVGLVESEALAARLLTAVEAADGPRREVVIDVPAAGSMDEREEQRAAVRLLDAVCIVFD